MLCELNQAKAFEQFTRLLLGLAARHPAHIQSQHDVLLNGPPGQKQWLLRHISRSAGPRALLIAINDYFSSIRLLQPSNNIEQCALATAARSNERDKFPRINSQIHSMQRRHLLATLAKTFRDALKQKLGLLHASHLLADHLKSACVRT